MKSVAFVIASVIICAYQSASSAVPLLPPSPDLPPGWNRAVVPDVGTIDMPPTMEVQAGKYAEFSQSVKSTIPEMSGKNGGRVFVIQPRGVNAFDTQASARYMRILVETDLGKPGDFEVVSARFSVTETELQEISRLFRTNSETPYATILQWDAPSLDMVNGMQALRISYRRQMKSNPPVRVTMYVFQNYDRIHRLTMSYRESERALWLSDFPAILASFRITNIQSKATGNSDLGTTQSVTSPGNPDPPSLWELLFMMPLTWGIGLGPALILRFLILRHRIEKSPAVFITAALWMLNIVIVATDTIFSPTRSRSHAVQVVIAVVIFWLLTHGGPDVPQLPKGLVETSDAKIQRNRHSLAGVWSFVLSLVAPMGLLSSFVVLAVQENSSLASSSASRVAGAAAATFAVMTLYAFGLGVAGLLQKDKKRVFSILGIVFSSLMVLGGLILMLIAAEEGL